MNINANKVLNTLSALTNDDLDEALVLTQIVETELKRRIEAKEAAFPVNRLAMFMHDRKCNHDFEVEDEEMVNDDECALNYKENAKKLLTLVDGDFDKAIEILNM